jgi:hypothetical protein
MTDQLELAPLHRSGSVNPQKTERHTFDFVVNGLSLFEATHAVKYDMCGSLADPQFEGEIARRLNGSTVAMLTLDLPADGHRVALFICPECGDFTCGAITALVSPTASGVLWSALAYENGYDTATELGLGPFEFERAAYSSEMERLKVD